MMKEFTIERPKDQAMDSEYLENSEEMEYIFLF